MTQKQISKYNSKIPPTWCKGCGNFGIFTALKAAFAKLGFSPDDVCLTYDVGCSSNMADFLNTYGFHSLHGRTISTAIGLHLAHHQFPVIAIGGDGGIYGEGVEHLIEAARGNFDITAIVHNNFLYSLTTGQKSPTAQKGSKTKSTPFGTLEVPFEGLKTAIIHDPSFVARGYALETVHLTDLIVKGIKTKGFSLIDVLQPCVTFNKKQTPDWYKKRVYKLEKDGYSQKEALKILDQEPEKLAIGILYRSDRKAYHEHLPQLKNKPLIKQSIEKIDIGKLIEEFI